MAYKILCVDELTITKIELSNMLKSINADIISVKDEIEAINALHDNKKDNFDAIVWALNYADLKDFESIKSIKNKEAYKHIPVIIISKFTDKRYVIKAIEAGAAEFIARPYDIDVVMKKIHNILGVTSSRPGQKRNSEDIITYSFPDMFSKEIKAASRGGYPLSLIMATTISEGNSPENDAIQIIDLINKVIKSKLRETDVSFLYSNNNLVIILPFSDKEGAKIVEKKVQDIYGTNSVIRQKSKGFNIVTATVTFPDDGKIRDRLLERLEKNLNECIKTIYK